MVLGNEYNIALEMWGTLFSFAIFVSLWIGKGEKTKEDKYMSLLVLCNTFLLFSDMMAWYLDGSMTRDGYFWLRVFNFAVFEMNVVMMVLFTAYALLFIKHSDRILWGASLIYLICVVYGELVIISQFTGIFYSYDAGHFYQRGPYFMLSHLLMLLCMIIGVIMLTKHRADMSRERFMALIGYIVLPFIATCLQIMLYGYSLSLLATTISVFIAYAVSLHEKNKIIMQQDKKLQDMRIKIVLSQIKPHFLYNCLNTIYILCRKDSEQARKAISDFSDYLRCNMNSITKEEMISFEKEMVHVKSYLALEKMRFQDELEIEYDIQAKNFMIPPLTVEPLVENAVKHGVGKKTGGGRVCLSTREDHDKVYITIRDNGVGFVPGRIRGQDSEGHIGLANVRSRLAMMCHGRLKIDSRPGEGTKITIILDKA